MTIVRFETDPHTATQSLLPWYATERLDADDRAFVEAHLAGCAICRAELAIEAQLRALQSEVGLHAHVAGDADRGWSAMRARIAADEDTQTRRRPARVAWWLRWALGGQAVLVAGLAGALLWPHVLPGPAAPEAYRALGAPGAAALPNAIVMFRPETTEAQMRAALRISGARLVGGPTTTNAYLLSLPPTGQVAAIAALRAQTGVSLAESLDASP